MVNRSNKTLKEKSFIVKIPFTLSRYIGKQFLTGVAIVLSVLVTLIILFDTLELIKSASSKNVPFGVIIELVFLKLPTIIQKIIPFAILLGGILTFSRLTRTSELIVARAAGVSAWQFLAPAVIISFGLGFFIMTVFNPLAAIMLSRFEQVEAKYMNNSSSMLSVSSTGLWLRQKNKLDNGKTVIHSLRVEHENMELFDVTIFMFGENNKFIQRVDAPTAKLEDGYWDINDAILTIPGKPAASRTDYRLKTDLSKHRIQESFASPETLSFWELPGFIATLQEAGFSALRHSLHWHSILVTPFFLSAMVFFAAAFSLRPPRQGKTGALMTGGILAGFIIYFMSDLVAAIGLSGSIPVAMAAWAPVGVSMLLGTVLMLHLEDG
ncbi:MAG: lptG [Rickettsiaceae bacterium]|nr:lptG [Burkholderiales bacterium]MCE3232683.1 lptG [Rickettsiaceae bacterium]